MKTFELKMNRARWLSLVIVVLCVALIIMMLSPYFTYGKASTATKPGEGTKDMLFGKTWIKTGTAEGDENYEALVISKDGKNSTYVTTNKLRYNQQYTQKVFEDAIENYRVMKNNLEAAVANEEAAWDKYYELGEMCNKLAATMGKAPFALKDKAATEAAEESSGEGGEATEEAATEDATAEEDTIVLAQEGDPFAEEFKTLTNSMKAANRAVDNAVKARIVAEDALADAKKACESAYDACLTAYSYNADGTIKENAIDPEYALVKVSSEEYNKVLVEDYENDYVNALIENKDKDYKNWLVEHEDLYKSFAQSLGITDKDVFANVVSSLLTDDSKKADFVDGFIKANEADFNSFTAENSKAVIESMFAELVGEVKAEDAQAFAKANEEAFKAYVNENREVLKTRLYDDISDKTRTRVNFLTALKNDLYRDFVANECADEFKAFVLDEAKKQNIQDTLYGMYLNGESSTLFNDLYSEFVTNQKEEQFKEYLTKLAIDGASGALKTKIEKIASDNKQELYQGNLKLMAEDFAQANIDQFHEEMVYSKVSSGEDTSFEDSEAKKNTEYKLYANSKLDAFSAWINGKEDADALKDEAYKTWITAKKVATKDKNSFYTNVFKKLSAEEQAKYNREFFDLTEPTLKDSDKDAILKATKAAVLTRISNEELDNAIYGSLNNMLSESAAAYAKAEEANKLTTSSAKDGKASNTSGKAEKQVTQIQKQIEKVQPIFDEVEIIVAKEKKYNDLLNGDEATKDAMFEAFIAENNDLFQQMVLKQEAEDTKNELYSLFSASTDTSIDEFADSWNSQSATYIEQLIAKLEGEKGENGNSKLDELYSMFILSEHNTEFKDWLYAQGSDEEEEGTSETASTAKASSSKSKTETKEVDAATFRTEFLNGNVDPKTLEEAASKTSVSIETPVTVAYSAGKEANDPASVTLTFANGDVKKTEFDTVLSYDKVQKISILGFIAFPDDYADDFEIPVANYKIQAYSRNSIVLLPILLFILLIVSIVLAIIKRDTYVSGILPVVTGIIGVLAFLFNTFLKLGDNPTTFVICFAVLLVVGCLQICLYFKGKKQAEQ